MYYLYLYLYVLNVVVPCIDNVHVLPPGVPGHPRPEHVVADRAAHVLLGDFIDSVIAG